MDVYAKLAKPTRSWYFLMGKWEEVLLLQNICEHEYLTRIDTVRSRLVVPLITISESGFVYMLTSNGHMYIISNFSHEVARKWSTISYKNATRTNPTAAETPRPRATFDPRAIALPVNGAGS